MAKFKEESEKQIEELVKGYEERLKQRERLPVQAEDVEAAAGEEEGTDKVEKKEAAVAAQ